MLIEFEQTSPTLSGPKERQYLLETTNRSSVAMPTAYCFVASAITIYFHLSLQRDEEIEKKFLT